MSKTIALRTELQKALETLTTNVYYEEAPSTATYPYVVFELSELVCDYGLTTIQLEVNAIDYGSNTTAAENLADNIQDKFNKYSFFSSDILFNVYKGQRQNIKEDDKQIIRRRMLFEIRLREN